VYLVPEWAQVEELVGLETGTQVLPLLANGLLLVLLVYSLFIFVILKWESYFFFTCFILIHFLLLNHINGYSFYYFQLLSDVKSGSLIRFLLTALYLCGLFFTRSFLGMNRKRVPEHQMFIAAGVLAISAWMLSFFLAEFHAMYVIGIVGLLLYGFIMWLAYRELKNGVPSTALFFEAFAFYALAASFFILMINGKIGSIHGYQEALLAGTALLFILLTLAMTERISMMDSELKTLNFNLEKKITERTNKLEMVIRVLERLATVDGLTGIANRRQFENYLEREWKAALREGQQMSLILVDVDHFKKYNDHYGHVAGDDVLRKVASNMEKQVKRARDLVCRYGGEEFAIIIGAIKVDEKPGNDAQVVAPRICKAIENLKIRHEGVETSEFVTVSVGVYTVKPDSFMNTQSLIEKADIALYTAKNKGRNQVVYYEDGMVKA
jgi:two-component system, sensor histidine kinase LadS